ncbi:MAG: ABC transporter substrate-binding protein [Deltaproteobacteria bacterium]|jgi:iron complex transport system substrate-binding protein|nr:ABC transporter substrate-binding protein [Deltaproteobacteria bacterium]
MKLIARIQKIVLTTGLLSLVVVGSARANFLLAQYPMSFENNGRVITIKRLPKKVLVYGVPAAELMVALGLTSSLAGRAHKDGDLWPECEGALQVVPKIDAAQDKKTLDIIAGADLIIGRFALGSPELSQVWPPVYVLAGGSVDDLYLQVRQLGQIFQIPEQAEKLLAVLSAGLFKVTNRLKEYEPIKTLVFDFRVEGIFAPGRTDFVTRLVGLAGGNEIFSDQPYWSRVTVKEIFQRQPEAIIVPDYGELPVELKVAKLKADPVLSKLAAVANDKILVMSLTDLSPGIRVAQTVEALAQFFHPSLF